MKRSSWILTGLAVIVLVVGAWLLLYPSQRLPADALASVPSDAIGVVRLRVDRLLAADAVQRVLIERGHMRGVERIKQLCGFHPLRGLREAVLFARPGPEGKRPKVALIARGDLQHTRLVSCIGKFGRSGFDGVVQEEIHGIRTMRSENGAARAAFIGSDGLIAGDGESVSAAIAALLGKAPSAAQDTLLAPLYRELDPGSDVALAARTRGYETALARVLADLGLAEQVPAGELQALTSSAKLRTDAFSVRASIVTAHAELSERLIERAEHWRGRILAFPALELTGFARPIRALQLTAEGTRATLVGDFPVSTLAAAFDLLPAFIAVQRGLRAPPAIPPQDAGATPPKAP